MDIEIRQEKPEDLNPVFKLLDTAFKNDKLSDHNEQFLVERLRKSNSFIPDLSLVAVVNDKIVGYILLTKVLIKNNQNQFESLALAPVAVLPEYQNRGIGSRLITKSHDIAKAQGFNSIVLLGHEKYYPKFGYVQASKFNITFPFEAPKENCMVKELVVNALVGITGVVEYPVEFNS